MFNFNEFKGFKEIAESIDSLFNDMEINEDSYHEINEGKRGRVKKAIKTYGKAVLAKVQVDSQVKTKLQQCENPEQEKKVKESGKKQKEALDKQISAANDVFTTDAVTDRLQHKVAVAKNRFQIQASKQELSLAKKFGDNAKADEYAEELKQKMQKEKELEKKLKQDDEIFNVKNDTNKAEELKNDARENLNKAKEDGADNKELLTKTQDVYNATKEYQKAKLKYFQMTKDSDGEKKFKENIESELLNLEKEIRDYEKKIEKEKDAPKEEPKNGSGNGSGNGSDNGSGNGSGDGK